MFENNFDHETETREATYYPSTDEGTGIPGEAATPKKKKGKKTAKIIGAICLLLAVSAGSIAGYKYIDNNGLPLIGSSSSDTESGKKDSSVTTNTSTTESKSNSVDLLKISTKSDALTTQQIYDKVIPSVVGVSATYEGQATYNPWFGESQANNATATGTGIIMSDTGYVLTNAHVIYDSENGYGAATKISILLYDENEYEAKIVAYDTATDIAVLDIVNDVDGLVSAEFGNSDELKVGDNVVAIGNPLGFDLFGTLTVGYISGLNREVSVNDISMGLIQTDAAINSGNSGGPLINCYGQVIGINSLKMANSYSSATIEGLGFAIPITSAKSIIDDLIEYGYVSGRPQIGVSCKTVTSYNGMISGAQIMAFSENSPAEAAGLKINDVIVGVNNKVVTDVESLQSAINAYSSGEKISLTIIRDGRYSEAEVTLTERTAEKQTETTTATTTPDPRFQS